jgi:hypothetical protein
MLDTKLGVNDGAPLFIGKQSIQEEAKLQKNELYPYWQAFATIISPNIIAQGLLKDDSKNLTPPDYIHLANWGTLVDHPWSESYKQGRSFTRSGETEKDTALVDALYTKTITNKFISVL